MGRTKQTTQEKNLGINTPDKNVSSGISGMYDTHSDNGFVKNPAKLLYQYDNLLRAEGKRYAKWCHSKVDRENLYSYIKDAFLSLVIEYDPYSGVDFPGYIKGKLSLRIYNSYLTAERDYSYRNSLLKSSIYDASDLLSNREENVVTTALGTPPTEKKPNNKKGVGVIHHISATHPNDLETIELYSDIEANLPLTDLQKLEIELLLSAGVTSKNLVEVVQAETNEYTVTEIKDAFEEVKTIVTNYLDVTDTYPLPDKPLAN